MDIIVTTPKSQIANAAQEAADCIADGGGEYFRRFPFPIPYRPLISPGERVFYVEDGWIRGYALVDRVSIEKFARTCHTTGRQWPPGIYVFMDATTWQWIYPLPMRGFQGFRYARQPGHNPHVLEHRDKFAWIQVVGDWRDPKPPTPDEGDEGAE